ncbi:MAG: hypothetical protein COW00_01835 [Bdellovibrio sp. CG12_big_fil_rev_8_21_14_0_65_39_13]|nr:MAG: hypothetical protein COW78_09735 [Bdellovibrio sp. CG22_combo_CG10-13_8_21_14_all_39_27]PIQ62340.1 MAG: hypothetical protein COW00_01835 [Bdellovibrio sp. CG12_big_fil_rev_8_21_14_0_65_39_13]PIR32375.1 MAG: hypothetical protein COV37_19925 [Bdellovibrio sp. CG11_big_fil_rev_8_21_14_0_20_39_38]
MQHITLTDEQWTRLSSILPKYKPSNKGGRPRLELKKVFEGILYVKINKLPWKAVPAEYGSKTAINDYFRHWKKAGIFKQFNTENIISQNELIQLYIADFEDNNSCSVGGVR